MKILGLVGLAGIVGGGVYLHGPLGAGGERYPIPAVAALERVQNVEFPGRVKGMLDEAGFGGGAIDRAIVPGKSVIFTFRVKDQPIGTYTVTADVADAGSSDVGTDFKMTDDAAEHMRGVVMPMAKQFAIVGKAMVAESVDAALDGRPYDRQVDMRALSAYTMANSGEIMRAASAQMDKAAALNRDPGPLPQSQSQSQPRWTPPQAPAATFVPGKPMSRATPSP